MQAQLVAAPLIRGLAAAITLGSGASLGPEGPSVEIGRSTARGLGELLRSKRRRLVPLLAAGSGAGRRRELSHQSNHVRVDQAVVLLRIHTYKELVEPSLFWSFPNLHGSIPHVGAFIGRFSQLVFGVLASLYSHGTI